MEVEHGTEIEKRVAQIIERLVEHIGKVDQHICATQGQKRNTVSHDRVRRSGRLRGDRTSRLLTTADDIEARGDDVF